MTSRGPSSADALAARLAGVSRLVAGEVETALPAMRAALGRDVERWLELGVALAEHTGNSAGATIAFLRLEPARVRRAGLAALARWVDATAILGREASPLAAAYAEATAPLLGTVDLGLLETAAREAAGLRAGRAWRGERVALAMIGALPDAVRVLAADDVGPWCRLAATLRPALDEGIFFRALPAEVAGWPGAERRRWLEAAHTIAERNAQTALPV